MEKNISRILFITAWIVIVVGIINGIDSTLYYHATQYVPKGEKPEPLRITEIINDIVYPFKDGGLLIGLAYLIKYVRKTDIAK